MNANKDFFDTFRDLYDARRDDYELTFSKLASHTELSASILNKWYNRKLGKDSLPERTSILSLVKFPGFSNNDINQLLQAAGCDPLSQREFTPLPDPTQLDRYLSRVYHKESIADFSLFQAGQEKTFSSNHALDEIYVSLRLAGQAPWMDELETSEGLARQHETKDIPSTRLLAPKNRLSRHLTLLGDAGSGKTTILRHLVGALAKARLDKSPDFARQQTGLAGEPLIPLLIPLRHYAHFCQPPAGPGISLNSFLDFLPVYVKETYNLDLDLNFFRQLLESGASFLALDGFDEVPDEFDRRQVVTVVRDLATYPDSGHNTILLSSRVAAYGGITQLGGKFQTLWVQPLDGDERKSQVEKWVAAIGPQTERPLNAEDILKCMPEGSPLDQLAVTPMIVTTLCVVYFYDYELPEQRARLYRRCVDIILTEKLHLDTPGKVLMGWGGEPDLKRNLLARLAFELHRNQPDIAQKQREAYSTNKQQAALWLKDGFSGEAEETRLTVARQFLEAVTVRGTLLQERNGQFGFGRQHLTFQEFLAGYHLGITLRPRERKDLWPVIIRDDRWREPIRLAIGAAIPDNVNACLDLLEELLAQANDPATDPAAQLAGYKLAAEGLLDLGAASRLQIEIKLQKEIIDGLANHLFTDNPITRSTDLIQARISAAQILARLGDPRPGVGLRSDGLPDIAWVRIPAGPFLMGDGKKPDKAPLDYSISRYPITNAQYQAFVAAGGYTEECRHCWTEAGWEWKRDGTGPESYGGVFDLLNHPVVGVSWYEAVAFCRWLTIQFQSNGDLASDQEISLPSEQQWEKAARGTDGRKYPWDDDSPDSNRANYSATGLGSTSAVGCFPAGASPYGCLDMAGNVWEWCADWLDVEQMYRVLRGGSWSYDEDALRCASRNWSNPYYGYNDNGFRVVVSPIFK